MKIRLARASGSAFGVDDISCAAATDLGLFQAEGLEVEWSDWRGGVAATNAALEGAADVAYAGFGPVLAARAQGKPCRIFVSQARALAQALVVRKDLRDLKGAAWAVDGIGALSHHMARLVVRAKGLRDEDIRWQVVGPPPLRIEALLAGKVDAALVRTEEALVLHRDHADRVRRLLDFDELKRLVPLQPHGVLATTEAFEKARPAALHGLARAMIRASRTLHADWQVFARLVRSNSPARLDDAELRLLWQREHDSGGWAIDGEMTPAHWNAQLSLFREINPALRPLQAGEVLAPQYVGAALEQLGKA